VLFESRYRKLKETDFGARLSFVQCTIFSILQLCRVLFLASLYLVYVVIYYLLELIYCAYYKPMFV